jgi:hypothetical protein
MPGIQRQQQRQQHQQQQGLELYASPQADWTVFTLTSAAFKQPHANTMQDFKADHCKRV